MLSTIYIIPFLIIATPCWADLPLKIEDLLTEKQKFRFELRLGYANADRSHLNTNFALLKENRDILALTLGARYGITARTELYSRLTAAANDLRTQNNDETHSYSSKQWKDLVLGVNHQFSADNDTPALLGFAEILSFENTVPNKSDFVYGKTGKIGFTTYRSIDPVILSLTGGYSYAARREVNEQSINPGNLLFINPKLSFVINDEVTLTGGAQFQLREKTKWMTLI